MAKIELPISVLREHIRYDAETGSLIRIKAPRHKQSLGKKCDTLQPNGYLAVWLKNKKIMAHRVCWALHYGSWPKGQIDHVNGVRHDNRIENLRDSTPSQNGQNQSITARCVSGFKGARPKPSGRYEAQIGHQGRRIYIGTYDTPQEAHAAYLTAKSKLHTFAPILRTTNEN